MSASSPPAAKIPKLQDSKEMSEETNGNSTNGKSQNGEFDHNLYSRQLYALGEAAMRRLRTSCVLISGMGGLGIEIAKNLTLGGVRNITIQDTKVASHRDLGSQYFLNESKLGQNRASASADALAELNDSVTLAANTQPLSLELIQQFDLTILTDSNRTEQLEVNEWTRTAGKKLLVVETRGLFSYIFNDYGSAHRIEDSDGEQYNDVLIEHIDNVTGNIMCLEDSRHNLETGDYVTFSEVKGMDALNNSKPLPVKVISPMSVSVGGEVLENMGKYVEGGRMKRVKMPKDVSFKPMKESMSSPAISESDFAKLERPPQLHLLWETLHRFEAEHKRSPAPRVKEDCDLFMKLANEINSKASERSKVDKVDESLAMNFSYQAWSELIPMCGFMGGVAAQEAMKGITGLFTPINQWFYFDALECLPDEAYSQFPTDKLTPDDVKQKGNRYDCLASVFGWKFVEALHDHRQFIVGAGAIGCELLKNYAMLGVGCGPKGKITVTDMDRIEVSNLNRQFLFRKHDVGSNKSETAGKAVKGFNADLNITALSERVGGDTENIFNDGFFEALDGVSNALDNVEARAYMDRRCVYYQLPLLESGTMGPKGNTQVVYPFLTESYSSSTDPPEKSIPICTLKNFPNAIEHTIQWSRDAFEGYFAYPAETTNQYLKDQRAFFQRLEKMNTGQKMEMLSDLQRFLNKERPKTAEDCVIWARKLFQENFVDTIKQLLHNFPPDQLTSQGVKFWSGAKRCPKPIEFDVSDAEHVDFVYAGSILRAELYQVQHNLDRETVAKIASEFQVKQFVPRDIKIAANDEEAKAQAEAMVNANDCDENDLENLKLGLAKLKGDEMKALEAVDFEKDDDTNHHMEFITACSNLRAANYSIVKADLIQTKKVAGRIIPALATTTAAVSGLVSLELLKIVAGGKDYKVPIERFKNGFLNLALPFIAFSEPIAAPEKQFNDTKFTIWDSLTISGPMTIDDLINWLKDTHKMELSMLSVGVSLLYSFFMNPEKAKKRKALRIEEAVKDVTSKDIPGHVRTLTLEPMVTDLNDEDVEIPYIKYNLAS